MIYKYAFGDSRVYIRLAKDIKLLPHLRRAVPRGFNDAACLYRKSLNPSGVN